MLLFRRIALTLLLMVTAQLASAERLPEFGFRIRDRAVEITTDGEPLATYVFRDDKITRPYFAHVRLAGQQLTRNHPPVDGTDATDHATMHPGIWLSFGDISGHDYWRLKARTQHVEFVQKPHAEGGELAFAVRNRYLSTDGNQTICEEVARFRFAALAEPPGSFLLFWDSTFSSDQGDFYFGDQEEMGLGVRVATPLAVNTKAGGRILNSHGQRDERELWGKAAAWCDYGGLVDDSRLGIVLLPHPDNFRPCWFHARNYGFVAANPFGRKAFRAGPPSKVAVRKGESLRLRFGVLLYASPKEQRENDWAKVLEAYVQRAATPQE